MNGKQLRNSILQEAISGRLVPQDPNDEPATALLHRINPKATPLAPDDAPFPIPDSWCWCKVGDIVQINPKNDYPDDTMAAFIPMEKMGAAYGSQYTYDEVKWGSIKKGYTHFANGDVAFAKITPCFQNRKSAVFKDLPNGIGAGTTEIKVLRPYGETLNRWYLLYFLKSSYFIAEAKFKGTANQQRVVKGYLENKMFPLPPLAEQERIVQKVEELMPLVERYDKAQTELDRLNASLKGKLRASVLQEAIAGRLVPQNPNDEPAIELLKRINPKFTPQPTDSPLPPGWTACGYKDIFSNITSKPYQILQSQIKETGKTPVISQSASYIEGYSDEDFLLQHDEPLIVFGDHTKVVKYVDFDFIVGADGVKIIEPLINRKYAFYLLLYASTHIYDRGYARHFSLISKFVFLVPPLAEQERIVQKVEELFAVLDALQ